MSFSIVKVKGLNLLIYLLIALQLLVLIGIAVILISAISKLSLMTTVSTTIMFLVGLPILIFLCFSSIDKASRVIFYGLTANILLLSISGIIWYLLSGMLGFPWLVQAAKGIMVAGYLPLIYALFMVYSGGQKKLDRSAKAFIGFVNITCSLAIIVLAITNLSTGDAFDIAIYAMASVGDIIVLALAGSLILIRYPTMLRYIISAVFCLTLLSLAGDGLNFIDSMNVTPNSLAAYSQYFYDLMLLFTVSALIIYFFFQEVCTNAVEEVNKRLYDTRHAMDDLLTQMPDATCIFNPAGDVLMVNDPFLKVFGVDREDIPGKFNLFKYAGFLQCDLNDKIALLQKGETIVIDKARVEFQDGRTTYLSFKIFPTFSQDNTISSYISICEDITARVRADEELKQAKALSELYLDLMGHDINNMNQIGIGYLEIALSTIDVGDDNKRLLAKPMESMMNSSRLIDNVKKLRRANDSDMHLRPVDLDKLLKEVVAEHGQAPGKEVSIRYDGGDAMVKANELLKDVFANLVSNAVRHSNGEAIHINIRQGPVEEDGKKYYRVVVEDDGPGIPEGLKPVIFDRILRRRAGVGGNGIGLYLVKMLVNNFGGSIVVEDRAPGEFKKGARFIVTLPAA